MNKLIDFIKNIALMRNEEAYIVGGYVREKLIDKSNKIEDIDIIYNGNVELLIEIMKGEGYVFFPIKIEHGLYRYIDKELIIDICRMKGEDIKEDLGRRDFTINSIAIDLSNNELIDPFNGMEHIRQRVLCQVSSNSIKDDPIRILRAGRFCIKYGYDIEINTENSIHRHVINIKNYAKERIMSEFMKLIKYDYNGEAFYTLDKLAVLKYLIPYTEELKTIGQCKYHKVDAFTHMNMVYKVFKDILNKKLVLEGLNLDIFKNTIGGFTLAEYVAFSAFVHDIGKYNCYRKEGDRVSFYGHNEAGSKIIHKFCDEMLFPKVIVNLVSILVEAHMYPLCLFNNSIKDYKKAYYKFFNKYKEYVPYILTISFCDIYATRILDEDIDEIHLYGKFISNILKEYYFYNDIICNRLVRGNEIVELTGKEGKVIGDILEKIDEMRYYSIINTKEDVVKFIKYKNY